MLHKSGKDPLVVSEHLSLDSPTLGLNRCNFLVNLFENSEFLPFVVHSSL